MAKFMILTGSPVTGIVCRNLVDNNREANLALRAYADAEQWFLNTSAVVNARPFYFRKLPSNPVYTEYMWKQSLGLPVAL